MSDSSENPPAISRSENVFMGAFIAILTASITVLAQYYITYQSIERPKIEIEEKRIAVEEREIVVEEKKVSIEAHKQALSLSPITYSTCSARRYDDWTWKVSCVTKNPGQYPVDVHLSEVQLYVINDETEHPYDNGNGFSVTFPNGLDKYRSVPGVDGDLWFYIRFDKKQYPTKIMGGKAAIRISFSYQTIQAAEDYMVKQFPELGTIVQSISHRGFTYIIGLED